MGTPETVVKRACPCSSTFMPVGAPIGRSGAFSRVGASVFSAQFFSASEERRFSKTSATGFSATCGLDCFFSIRTPVFCCDDREASATGQGGGRSQNDRSVWMGREIICRDVAGNVPAGIKAASAKVPTPWHISTRRRQRGRGAIKALLGRRESRVVTNSCKRKLQADAPQC